MIDIFISSDIVNRSIVFDFVCPGDPLTELEKEIITILSDEINNRANNFINYRLLNFQTMFEMSRIVDDLIRQVKLVFPHLEINTIRDF